ncbi:pyridoxal phosphate-dependent transferase [Mycena galericulata]|nr:pyridoxal phosphate-dependent transferase [Mycena galericulata]
MSRLGFKLSRGVLGTIGPPIPLAYTWAEKYALTHGPLLDMSQGTPGSPPQKSLQSALAISASSLESFGYCPSEGELALRQEMAVEMRVVYGDDTDVRPSDMSLTSGCNLAFVATIMTLADAGDEVILPVPWYFNHQMTLSMLNITTVPLKTRAAEGFAPSVSECKALITPKTRAIVLVTPNNPTGATYSPELIQEFCDLAQHHNVALIVDETYRDFITPPRPPHRLFSNPSWRTHLIHLFSFSKAYAVPGHRLGLVVASPAFQTPLGTILDSLQICPPRPIQLALAPLLASLRPGVLATAHTLAARRALFQAALPKAWAVGSIGAYFAFVRHPFPGRGSTEVCRRLAEEMGVVLLPAAFFGSSFGDPAATTPPLAGARAGDKDEDRWIRFSVASCDEMQIRAVCARLERCEALFGWERE